MTFKTWLKSKADEITPIGLFAKTVRVDANFPETSVKDEIRAYLSFQLTGPETLKSFEAAWREYELMTRR